MQIVCLGGLFAWGSMCGVSSLCKACFWSLGRVPDAPPKSKVCCPFCVTSPWGGVTKIYLHLSSGNYLGVVHTLETFVLMYPIPMLGHIRYFNSLCITLHLMWCVNRFQGLISLMCFTCSFWKKGNTHNQAFCTVWLRLFFCQITAYVHPGLPSWWFVGAVFETWYWVPAHSH